MKKLLAILSILTLIPLVSAIQEGDIFTQAQIDAFNTDQITPQFLQCQEGGVSVQGWFIHKHFSCLNIFQRDDGDYEVFREESSVSVRIDRVVSCLERADINTCKEYFVGKAIEKFQQYISSVKTRVNDFKTINTDDVWLNWLLDILG